MLRTNTSTIQQRLQIELNKKLSEYAERSGSKAQTSSETMLTAASTGGTIGSTVGSLAPGAGTVIGFFAGTGLAYLICRIKIEFEKYKINQAKLVIPEPSPTAIHSDEEALHIIVVKALEARSLLLAQIKDNQKNQEAIINFFALNIIKVIKNRQRLPDGAIDAEDVIANLGRYKSKKAKSCHLEVNEGVPPLTLDELLLNKRSIVGANQWLASRWGRSTRESSSIENSITENSVSRSRSTSVSESISESDAKILSPANS